MQSAGKPVTGQRQARENVQQVLSVGKHITSAKRRKTCNWTLAETYFRGKLKPPAEKVDSRPRAAGNHATGAKRGKHLTDGYQARENT